MTIEELKDRIEELLELDPESAHAEEDAIHQDVLRAIADGAENARELAAVALTTKAVQFPRWYA